MGEREGMERKVDTFAMNHMTFMLSVSTSLLYTDPRTLHTCPIGSFLLLDLCLVFLRELLF